MRTSVHFLRLVSLICIVSCCFSAMSVFGMDPFVIQTPVYKITVSDDQYVIDFTLPDFAIEDIDVAEAGYPEIFHRYGYFHEIDIVGFDDYDIMDEVGYPKLPFFPVELLLPSDLQDINVYLESSTVYATELSYFIAPAIKGNTLLPVGSNNYVEIEYDEDYCEGIYQSIENSSDFISICQPYNVFDNLGVTLSICPFLYTPNSNQLHVLEEGRIIIEFNGEPLSSTLDRIRDTQTFKSAYAIDFFDKFPWTNIGGGNYPPSLLIVAATQEIVASLDDFVEFKENCGYNVDIKCLEDLCAVGNSASIKSLIREDNPNYVLLVGSLEQIPPASGSTYISDPYSDDGYHPFIGRWIITDMDDLRNAVYKTITAQQQFSFSNSFVSLLSGIGGGEDGMYKNICEIAGSVEDIGIPYAVYDGRQGGDFYTFQEAVQNSSIILYRGHGGEILNYRNNPTGALIGPPYNVSSYPCSGYLSVDEIESVSYPIGIGMACSLNTYEINNNFGAAWIASGSGGVSFYGATTSSYRTSNNVFAKRIFQVLKEKTEKNKRFTISGWLHTAETKYYNALLSPTRLHAIRRYNLIGDPTFKVYGLQNGEYFNRYDKMKKCDSEKEVPTISRMDIFSMNGQLLVSIDRTMQESALKPLLPQGVFLIRYYMSDGQCIMDKWINN